MTNETTKRKRIDGRFIAATLLIALFVIGLFTSYSAARTRQEQWKQTACPSLLSIGRSSRDTLIVMKTLASCNMYVLDNLK